MSRSMAHYSATSELRRLRLRVVAQSTTQLAAHRISGVFIGRYFVGMGGRKRDPCDIESG